MNNITAPIDVIDYKKNASIFSSSFSPAVTGYALPLTPFTFIPKFSLATLPGDVNFDYIITEEDINLATELEDLFPDFILTTELESRQAVSDKRVVWDFGDGTFGTGLTAKHYYTRPGVYTINSFFFNATGGVYKNTITPIVTCFNLVEDSFLVSVSSEYVISNQYTLTAGRIENPFKVYSQSSWQNVGSGENFTSTYGLRLLSGTADYFVQKLDQNKYGHLYPYSSFYDIDDDGNFIQVNEVAISRTPIYCAISANQLYFTTKDNLSSILCGVSGEKLVYVKDDRSGNRQISVFAKTFDYNNSLPIIMSCSFVPDSIDNIAISSTGITGEGKVDNTFDIDPVKYVGQKINFIVTLKDSGNFTVKTSTNLNSNGNSSFPNIGLVSVNSDGEVDNSLGNFASNFTYLSAVSTGFFKGTFTPTVTANNIKIGAFTNFGVGDYITLDDSITFITLDDSLTYITLDNTTSIQGLTAYSNTFTVYPSTGQYKIAKINEDFNFGGTLNELRYQEFLLDKTVLFDDFLGTAFGTLTSDPMSPGKLAYEKIANFTSNNVDVYTSNIQALQSMNSMIGGTLDVRNATNFGTPGKLKRLLDIVSINHSRLWGSRNVYSENFDPVLYSDITKYGVNLGPKLDFYTAVLTSGYDGYIVALERYSNKYTRCSTFISFLSTTAINPALSTYALSSYNSTWGWNLVLATSISGLDIPSYYDFYEYIPTPENSHYNNVINFDDPYTTISYSNSSYSEWIKRGGIVEEMIDNILLTGTGVLSS